MLAGASFASDENVSLLADILLHPQFLWYVLNISTTDAESYNTSPALKDCRDLESNVQYAYGFF